MKDILLLLLLLLLLLFTLLNSPQWARASSVPRPHYHRHTTIGRTPPDEWSARRRDLYLTTHNTHNRHPYPRRDSNPQSQQVSGRRCTPLSAGPLGSARYNCVLLCSEHFEFMTKKLVYNGKGAKWTTTTTTYTNSINLSLFLRPYVPLPLPLCLSFIAFILPLSLSLHAFVFLCTLLVFLISVPKFLPLIIPLLFQSFPLIYTLISRVPCVFQFRISLSHSLHLRLSCRPPTFHHHDSNQHSTFRLACPVLSEPMQTLSMASTVCAHLYNAHAPEQ